jgi:hypothetical protein
MGWAEEGNVLVCERLMHILLLAEVEAETTCRCQSAFVGSRDR